MLREPEFLGEPRPSIRQLLQRLALRLTGATSMRKLLRKSSN